MLLHINPRFYLDILDTDVEVIDLSIPELGITLKSGTDLVVRKPWPNKCYSVVCRKKGQKAIKGIFIETDIPLQEFTVITNWKVSPYWSHHHNLKHTVHFKVIDSDYDAVTDDIMMWNGFHNTPYRSRLPESHAEWIPAVDSPRMVFSPQLRNKPAAREHQISDVLSEDGKFLKERVEFYAVPTVERERLAVPFWGNDRFPSPGDAFSAMVIGNNLTAF